MFRTGPFSFLIFRLRIFTKEFVAKEKLEIAASFQEAKTAKESVKNIGSNHILVKENFSLFLLMSRREK